MTVAADPAAATLREVIAELGGPDAPPRRAGTEGEHRAAEWIAHRLRAAGASAEVEEESFHAGYAGLMRGLCLAGTAAGVAALVAGRVRPVRLASAALAAGAALAIADDVENGPRLARRAIQRREPTWNVVASVGDPDAPRTLVVLAHHDAAPTGAVFDQRAQAWVGTRFPAVIERIDTSVPLWWGPLGAHALAAAGALRGSRAAIGAGLAGAALSAAAFHDIACRPVVPGANDNLSGVAVLVALAQRLRDAPVAGLRTLLVSCGAEEVLQGGIHGFAARHLPRLAREATWFLNVETVGSPRLVLLEGEGPVRMRDYSDGAFRDLVARCAGRAQVPLRRGLRARSSTDAVVPSRAGYPTATLTSVDRHKALSHYHLMSDTPENVDYATVRSALAVVEAVAAELAG